MTKEKKTRESGIELLRILAVCGVIILHFNHPGAGGGFSYVAKGSLNELVLYFLETLAVGAVDMFIIISGYYMCTSQKRKLVKPFGLMLELEVVGLVGYLYNVVVSGGVITLGGIIFSLIPGNYYAMLYVTLYLISPYINLAITNMDAKQRRNSVIVLGLIFSVWPTMVDVLQELAGREFKGLSTVGLYGSQWGYSIVNFVLLYMIGAYLRLNQVEKDRKVLVLLIAIISVVLTGWSYINDSLHRFNEKSAWEYCNPLLIIQAVAIFMLFSQMKFQSRLVNSLAASVYTCYLVHNYIVMKLPGEWIVKQSVLVMLLCMLGIVIVIYLFTWLLHKAYTWMIRPVLGLFDKIFSRFGV